MSIFKHSKTEKEINKVFKFNQSISEDIKNSTYETRSRADDAISKSEDLLRSLGMGNEVESARTEAKKKAENTPYTYKPEIVSWKQLAAEANDKFPDDVFIEDLLSQDEIKQAFKEADEINAQFSRATSIVNKTDLCFLAIAAALQTAKALIYPYIAQQHGYGNKFDSSQRQSHDFFEREHKESLNKFRDKHQVNNPNGEWINIAFRSVPYDVIKGSKNVLDIGLNGKDHRLRTLGHDPILGWIFGTANILTDTVTLNTFQSYRITRVPKMAMTSEVVLPHILISEVVNKIKANKMNLPAALIAQATHLKSDVYSKQGLPVPILSTIDESFATELYKNQYDSLCLARDVKFITGSAGISILFDMIIGIIHSMFYNPKKDGDKKLYEVRTRKILLISNVIASSSSVIASCITQNPKQLDIGGLLVTISHLFTDLRFMAKVKQEFIENELNKKLQKQIDELDDLYNSMI